MSNPQSQGYVPDRWPITILTVKLLLISLLLAAHIASAQSTYYISSKGKDSNNGQTPNTPWKTIPYLQPGKTYLLNKGDTLYFAIGSTTNLDPAKKIRIGSYGTGAKPVLSLYKTISSSAWTRHSNNVWKANLFTANNFTGYAAKKTNVGILKINGKIVGSKRANLGSLSATWDYYSDDTFLYVFNTVSPAIGKPVIAANSDIHGIDMSDNMEVADISICGPGGHGISVYQRKNVTIRNVDINEVGGSFLNGYGNGTVRYGNGIEFFNSASNCLIEKCSVKQVYDAAFTMQGTGAFTDVIFRENTASDNGQSFETWLGSGSVGFKNCKFINNICTNAGLGWSEKVRPDKNVGVHLLTYLWQVTDRKAQQLLVEGNTFNKARSGLWYWGEWDPVPPIVSRNNKVTLDSDVSIRSVISKFYISNCKDFVSQTGLESGTVFSAIKKSQTINFSVPSAPLYAPASLNLQASASSKLPVTFTIKSGSATLIGGLIKFASAGKIVIEASQNGNDGYLAAPKVTQTITVQVRTSTMLAGSTARESADTLMDLYVSNDSVSSIIRMEPEMSFPSAQGFVVHPNPARDYAQIDFNLADAGHTSISIFNNRGELVKNIYAGSVQANANERVTLHTDKLVSGVYTVQLRSKSKSASKKLLIQK